MSQFELLESLSGAQVGGIGMVVLFSQLIGIFRSRTIVLDWLFLTIVTGIEVEGFLLM